LIYCARGSRETKGSVEHYSRALQNYYISGLNGMQTSQGYGDIGNVSNRINNIGRKIFVFELLEKKIVKEAESRGILYNRQLLKKIVKAKYRKTSEEEKEQLINEYDELLFSSILNKNKHK
jgi:hypothetical protein